MGDLKIGSMDDAMAAEFQHASFLRGHPEFLGGITRKKNVVRKLQPDATSGSGQVFTSAPPPLVVDTRMQRISRTSSTSWDGARIVPSSSNIPDSVTSFDVMESRFNELAEIQSALSREKFAGLSDSFAAQPLLAPNKPAVLHSQLSSSHLPTPFISDPPNSFDFSHPHFAPNPSSPFARSNHLLPPNFINASTPFDASDFMTTAHHITSRRSPPTQQTRQHHYNYDSSISFNMYLQKAGPLPIRANEGILSQIA
ncbi:hypothetical protein HDU78_000566, partial [Chytriomyces hyalinus]